MARSIYRIVQLEGAEKYKVQRLVTQKRRLLTRKLVDCPPEWVTMWYTDYGDKYEILGSLREAEGFVETLKKQDASDRAREADNWIPVKGEL